MTADPDIAQLAADMRARAKASVPCTWAIHGNDYVIAILDAFDARGREIERLTRERDEARDGVALLKAAGGANARIRRRMRRVRFYDPEKALGELGYKYKSYQAALAEARRMVETLERRTPTPAMIEAGVKAGWLNEVDSDTVLDIWLAMNARALADVKEGARDG